MGFTMPKRKPAPRPRAATAPSISVITPLHAAANRFIVETYKNLCAQTVTNWQWVILENNGGKVPAKLLDDSRVVVIVTNDNSKRVGALKKTLCENSTAPVIVELDADDLLHEKALAFALNAIEEGADFVYSDFAEFVDCTWQARTAMYPYGEHFGWRTYPVEFQGHELIAMHAAPVTAQNLRLIDWTPNHLRAWTRAAYLEAGGHDAGLELADDHDLCVKFFLAGKKMTHVKACLYFQRTHPANTTRRARTLVFAS